MPFDRLDPTARDDRALTLWRVAILLVLMLAIVESVGATFLGRIAPLEEFGPPFYITAAGDRVG
jgi:hypothetical protein